MNEEEVVVSTQPEEQFEQQPEKRSQTLGETLDNVQQGMSDVGRAVETFGKGEEQLANMIDGGEKAAQTVGTAASSAAEKSTDAAIKAAEAREKAAEATKRAAEASSRASAAGIRASEAASRAADAEAAASKASAAIPYAGAFTSAAGQTAAGIQKGVAEGSKAVNTAAKAASDTTAAAADVAAKEAKAEKGALTAANKAAKAGKKASDRSFADKLREKGKLHQAHGKRIQDQAEKFDADKFLSDKFGKAGKALSGIAKAFDPKVIGVISLLIITLGTLFVSYILSPLFFMDLIRQSVSDPDRVEKVNNYLSGLGFQDSKEAFYEEVDYLNIHYGKQLDYSYIMSALYYADIYYGDSEYLATDDNEKLCSGIDKTNNAEACNTLQMGVQLAEFYLKESSSTTDEQGLKYSANKIYRLRELAKHQFLGEKESKTVSLRQYLIDEGGKINAEHKKMLEYLPWVAAYILAHSDPAAGTAFDTFVANQEIGKGLTDLISLLQGTDSWSSISMKIENGKYDAGAIEALKNFITTYLGFYLNIEGIEFNIPNLSDSDSILDSITIKYREYSYDQDKFEDYLIDHYVKEMPEFSKLIRDDEGKISDDKVEKIVYEIKLTKDIFDGIYKTNESAKDENACIGDINLDLLNELRPPIDLTIGQSITFSGTNNYGYYKGIKHNGVDLEEESTGTKVGANVYSIYDGKVVESTVDKTFSDKDVKGGWLVIEYSIQYEDSTLGNSKLSKKFKNIISNIRVYYGGLNPTDLKLKKNDIVKKGDVIGHVGDAAASETGTKPSLHFGIYDMRNGEYLNPINMFITCKEISTSSGLSVHTISISKKDFISATNSLKESSDCNSVCKKQLNSWNLESVYDISKANNLNPELVVLRAVDEGFSPSGQHSGLSSYNNYWGIGCYNGQSLNKCTKYGSLENGIRGFANLQIVKNANTVEEMMKSYAVLNSTWTPVKKKNGATVWSGGCEFLPYIKNYYTNSSRYEVVYESCKNETRIKTNDEDQAAYTAYTCSKMNNNYKKYYANYH